ncbi:unnamed protein product, partial [Mesorhabditis belari]|uniref:FPL domain-containing protein n=1 Tax=Mesorhabditis belari TaxID=2138241 RepID=A0AAF3J1C2_9BILA
MLRRLGGSSGSLWKPKNPHSLEYLKYLQNVLQKNEKLTEPNRKIIVEALRAISEILIWGDQNDGSVFDFFLERQMLSHFLQIMEQDTGLFVSVQLLQTLNILFENIRHETSLYFLLSNNHVNHIITHRFDFSNEEILAYYVSFIKTLSMRLNPATIHFFFNETTNDFPLLTETLKLFDSKETMVRIAVRTVVLNIIRVKEEGLQKYLITALKVYLCDLIDQLVGMSIDLDVFVRSAENVTANRERLRDKVDDLIDIFHYVGDLLETNSIADSLSSLLTSRFIFPLLFNSLIARRNNQAVLLTPISALFYASQILLVISHRPLILSFLQAFLFEDASILCSQWIRSEDSYCLQTAPLTDSTISEERAFFHGLLAALDSTQNDDYLSFYALMVIYAMLQNKGDVSDILAAASIPHNGATGTVVTCEPRIVKCLIDVVESAAKADSRLRPITLELTCIVLRQLVLTVDDDNTLHEAIARSASVVQAVMGTHLATALSKEQLFLEMFEDEYHELTTQTLRLNAVGWEMLLPPAASPFSGLPLNKRLSSGHEERVRTNIQLYLHTRKLKQDMLGEQETHLPLQIDLHAVVRVGDCINLNNSDLLSVTVSFSRHEKQSRFLVTDRLQLILVEPDTKKAGWAIVTFVGLLQDTQITGDASDSRSLHVVVESRAGIKRPGPLLSARFIFDDHIRCMAAKQRLTKGRQNARQLKMGLICDLLGCRTEVLARSNPYKIVKGCAPGSARKQLDTPANDGLGSSKSSSNSIPEDPVTSANPSGSKIHHI